MAFASLHNHCGWGSILDSCIKPKELAKKAADLKMSAVALTDHGRMTSVIEFYEACRTYGIKPIVGIETYVCSDVSVQSNEYYHLILLAKNSIGYKNIKVLSSLGFTKGFYKKPRIDFNLLKEHSEGIICSTACIGGELPKLLLAKEYDKADEFVERYKDLFGDDFYLELQPANNSEQISVNMELVKLSVKHDVSLIATSDSHFLNKEDFAIHNVFLNISQERDNEVYADCWFKSEDEIRSGLDYISDNIIDKAIANTQEIAEKCNLEIELGNPRLPHVEIPAPYRNDKAYFKHLCNVGFEKRGLWDKDNVQEYINRLEHECKTILSKDFQGYFLILEEFMRECREDGIIFAPARGSGGGCLVAYLLNITDVDPIRFDLDFSRFLNEDRVNYPDLDIDVPSSMRQKLIQKLKNKFGNDNVAQIMTVSSMQAKAIVDSVGKAIDYDEDSLASIKACIPDLVDLKTAMSNNPTIYTEHKELIDMCYQLEGLPRSTSIHASAIVITPTGYSMEDFVPLMRAKDGSFITQYDMTACEMVGLVKFDFLGVAVLDIIKDALKYVSPTDSYYTYFDIPHNLFNDKAVYDLLCKGNTSGVFQVESGTMTDVCMRLKPSKFEDIVAILALVRPDTMGEIPDFIDIKHGLKEQSYIHEDLRPILEKTYSKLIYQEQLIAIVRKFGGFTGGEADLFRRAISKKKPDVIARYADQFKRQGIEIGYSPDVINKLYDMLMEKGNYLFNKSHAVGYAIVTYMTAYIKAHNPVEFMSSTLSNQKTAKGAVDYEGVSKYMSECKKLGIDVLYPNINVSTVYFTPNNGKILFGLGLIKGLGSTMVDEIIEKRPFASLSQLLESTSAEKSSIIALIKSGAIDSIYNGTRADALRKFAQWRYFNGKETKKPLKTVNKTHITFLFDNGFISESSKSDKETCLRIMNEHRAETACAEFEQKYMSKTEKEWEFESLSFFIQGSPFDDVQLPKWKSVNTGENGYLGGVVISITKKKIKNGKNAGKEIAFVAIEGTFGRAEVTFFSDEWSTYREVIEMGSSYVFFGKKESDRKMQVRSLQSLSDYIKKIR